MTETCHRKQLLAVTPGPVYGRESGISVRTTR
jgi:hypothetical protein